MRKITIICMTFAMIIAGCKRVDVDFTFSPEAPKAGQPVKFNNLSSEGESWNWDFGDHVESVLKNPTHTFTKPGTYLVTLVVDSAKYNTCTHEVTVYDTVPTFVASTDSICHYTDVILSANVYNPYGYALTYAWNLPDNCVLTAGTVNDKSIMVYFKDYSKSKTDSVSISITITQNGKTYNRNRSFYIHQTKAPSILMMMKNYTVKRQHIINGYVDEPKDGDGEDVHMFEITNDTTVTFNDSIFYASKMGHIFPNYAVKRMQLDAVAQKWYITTSEGLLVANFSGQSITTIDADATGALYVDAFRNLLFWATPEGLKAMPLIKSKNNQFATTPVLYNNLSDIDRIVVNNKYK